ncbi:hypothetical protein [Actinomadura alba]|uniref:DUF2188 domain-containing protein n=1 Tax=Actinomadura alba TaxID=406431 RepID=A0ABR7LIQ6_9ACTN|nr:hypothetical protein [Actinomadura alba]MBC6464640.1 hypothetical protein [Actinomadura alba]
MSDQECERLQRQHPDWRVWRADGGSWLATRRGRRLTEAQTHSGLAATLMEDTAEELRVALLGQARIEGTADVDERPTVRRLVPP